MILNDIDSLAEEVIDYILPVLSDNVIRITLGEGVNTRSIEMALKRFTLIGTTPRPSRVSRRLLHWLTVCDFKSYSRTESDLIVGRMLQNARLSASEEVAALIGTCCGGSLEKASIIVKRMQNVLGVADTSTAQEKVQNLLGGGDDRDYKPLPIQSAKDILEWMGYKRDDLPSTEMACKLRSLSGTEFEEYVASVFKSLGFAVDYTPVTGDHGIDLILRRGNERAAAQCKRWEDTVGEPEVRDFLGSMVAVGVKTGYFVTTGEFSAQAMEFGERNGIRMIGLDELLSLARQGESKQPGLRQGKSPTDT